MLEVSDKNPSELWKIVNCFKDRSQDPSCNIAPQDRSQDPSCNIAPQDRSQDPIF